MSYFQEWRGDLRRLLGEYSDLLLIALVYALSVAVSYNRYLRPSGLSPEARAGFEIAGRAILFTIPPLASAFLLKIPLRELGFNLGDPKRWLRDVLLFYCVMVPVLLLVAQRRDFRSAYPYLHLARHGVAGFIVAQTIQLVFMFAWEFLSRGYLLFGFYRRLGAPAIAVQIIPFVLLHIGKPEAECYGSAVAAIALAVVALRARSFYPAALLHYLVGVTLDILALGLR
ncbi:MAG: CPBP family glutamic-type intramembrane protease [candidate division WOR-3 bacterium]